MKREIRDKYKSEGAQAFVAGASYRDCPYSLQDKAEQRYYWQIGYDAAQRKANCEGKRDGRIR